MIKKIQKKLLVFSVILLLSFGNANAINYNFNGPQIFYGISSSWSGNLIPPNPLPNGESININSTCQYEQLTQLNIANGASLSINHEFTLNDFGLINHGNLQVINIGGLFIPSAATVTNNAVFNIKNTNNNGTIHNNGLLTNNLGNGFQNNVTGSVYNNGLFINDFTLMNSNIFENNGDVNGTTSITNNGTISGLGTFNNIINGNGTFSPGNASTPLGTLTINSASTQDFTGDILNMHIGSLLSYDKIVVTGDASLTGATINVVLDGAYMPVAGNSFTIIDAGSLSTTAPVLNLPVLTGGLVWSSTYMNGNLVLTVTLTTPLPIILNTFTASLNNLYVDLKWNTTFEVNNSHFEVQRSKDGLQFETLSQIPAKSDIGTETTYYFTDKSPLIGKNYYRLKQVDVDGRSDYSMIKSVTFDSQTNSMLFDFATNLLHVKVIKPTTLYLINMQGAIVEKIELKEYYNEISLAYLSQGIYVVKLNNTVLKINNNNN